MDDQLKPDTEWTDDEIVMTDMTPDTTFVFDRMTDETIDAVDTKQGEEILDIACGRAIDAKHLQDRGGTMTGIEPSDIMIEKAIEFLGENRKKMAMVRSLGENLPFADNSFDKSVCKGAMDHFVDIEKSMAEMARVTKPDGKVIIAIANFESLTCILGKAIWKVRTAITGKGPDGHPFWEPPDDHNHKFDLPVLKALMSKHCEIESITGISLMWGFPKWGAFTRKVPESIQPGLLNGLNAVAKIAPSLSDVLVGVGRPLK
jgi:SAM-dependent methyltransferase